MRTRSAHFSRIIERLLEFRLLDCLTDPGSSGPLLELVAVIRTEEAKDWYLI